jgi:hypothetical protein
MATELRVAVPDPHYSLIDVGERGMPTSRETKVLDELGDAIESVLTGATTGQGSTNVLFLARVTCDSRREWSFDLVRDNGWGAAQVFLDLYQSAFD